MFQIQVYSDDSPKPLITAGTAASTVELRGVVRLFRRFPSPPSPGADANTVVYKNSTTFLFIPAVPNDVSPADFCTFCGANLQNSSRVYFLRGRDDEMASQYSVIVKQRNQFLADALYKAINDKKFKQTEIEYCHAYYVGSVNFMGSEELAARPPPAHIELPTCRVCIERLDYDTSAIKDVPCEHSFECPCISRQTSCKVCRFGCIEDQNPTCSECGTEKISWICLICGFLGCGRIGEGHLIEHWSATEHCFSLELKCYKTLPGTCVGKISKGYALSREHVEQQGQDLRTIAAELSDNKPVNALKLQQGEKELKLLMNEVDQIEGDGSSHIDSA